MNCRYSQHLTGGSQTMKYSALSQHVLGMLALLVLVSRTYSQISSTELQAVAGTHAPARSISFNEQPDGAMVLRSRVDMVLVPVSVTDKQGRSVKGLSKDNFRVFDDNKQQGLQNVSLEDEPTSIAIVVDTSASMENKLPRAVFAMHELFVNANPQDEFFMVAFSDAPRAPVGFTSSARTLEDALVATPLGGMTALLDALSLAIAKMQDAKYSRRAIVVISDGGDNHSRETVPHLVRMVEESDLIIYSVGIYDESFQSMEEIWGPELLRKLSNRSGGALFDARDGRDISEAVRDIVNQVRTRYVLSYYPVRKPKDGKWHTIKVKLAGSHSHHLRVHAKAGYYAFAK